MAARNACTASCMPSCMPSWFCALGLPDIASASFVCCKRPPSSCMAVPILFLKASNASSPAWEYISSRDICFKASNCSRNGSTDVLSTSSIFSTSFNAASA